MDSIDIYYFIWYNIPNITITFIISFLVYWIWKITVQFEEIRIEKERLIVEKEQQRESLQLALTNYQREMDQIRDTERQLRGIIEQCKRDNKELRARTKDSINEIEEERRRLRTQNRQVAREPEKQVFRRNKNQMRGDDENDIFDNISKAVNIIGSIALIFIAGRSAFK